jgi:hypothetical protein
LSEFAVWVEVLLVLSIIFKRQNVKTISHFLQEIIGIVLYLWFVSLILFVIIGFQHLLGGNFSTLLQVFVFLWGLFQVRHLKEISWPTMKILHKKMSKLWTKFHF